MSASTGTRRRNPVRMRRAADAGGARPNPASGSKRRILIGAGVVVLLGLGIGLGVGLSGGGHPRLTFVQQVKESLTRTKAIYATFETEYHKTCKTATCIEDDANTALNEEGNAANLFNQSAFPARAQDIGTTYAHDLIAMQRTYQAISISFNKTEINKAAPDLAGQLKTAEADAYEVELALG